MQNKARARFFSEVHKHYRHLHRSFAWLVSITLHLGLTLYLGASYYAKNESRWRSPTPAHPIEVRLIEENLISSTKPHETSKNEPISSMANPAGTNAISPPAKKEAFSQALIFHEEPYYFHLKELTIKPEVIDDVTASFNVFAPDVSLKPAYLILLINEDGSVDKVVMQESEYPKKLADLIVGTFSKLKFKPGKIGDLPVKSQMKVEVTFNGVLPPSLPEKILTP